MEKMILITASALSLLGSALVAKRNWRRYGLLYLVGGVLGHLICYVFVALQFYTFPVRLFPGLSQMPFAAILTVFPFHALFGVRFSPRSWPWKIPFYWVIVHIGMSLEVWAESSTELIHYTDGWDAWDSYTWWWIYLLIMEVIGGQLVPDEDRNPLDSRWLHFGKLGWFFVHTVLIVTIFAAGVLTGRALK